MLCCIRYAARSQTQARASQFALSRRAKGAPSKPEDKPSQLNTTGVPAQSVSRPAGSGLEPGSSGFKSSGEAQPARLQQPAFAPSSSGQTGILDAEGQMAQEIAAENQKLLASMQPDEASSCAVHALGHAIPLLLTLIQPLAHTGRPMINKITSIEYCTTSQTGCSGKCHFLL